MVFNFEVKDIMNLEVQTIETKELYNLDNKVKASDWVREPIPKRGGSHEFVKLSSGINVKQAGRGTMLPNSIGYMYNNSNCVEKNPISVALFSTTFSSGNGVSVRPENFDRLMTLFAARKLISSNWLNGKDEYLKPNTDSEKYPEFSYDSLIFSLFHSSSNQSSLRQVEYGGELKDVKNEFFFMSKETILSLANISSNQECYNDARHSSDRFVTKLIESIENDKDIYFSNEAKVVIDLARELTIDSFKHRKEFDKIKPEYQINNWDCGWYQIKGLLNWIVSNGKDDNIAKKYELFKQSYKELGDKMRPMVYELGFLKK